MLVLISPPFSSFVVGNKLLSDTVHAHCVHTLETLFFLCSNDSPSFFVDDVLQPWTMVKLVLMQIVADVVVDVGDASMCQQLAHVRSDCRKFTDLGFREHGFQT